MADETVSVAVSVDDVGVLSIVAGPDSLLGLVDVDLLDGFTVRTDPLDPARLVGIRCLDPPGPAWLLDELLGAGTADRLARWWDSRAAGAAALPPGADIGAAAPPPIVIEVAPTPVVADVGRVGLLRWLGEHSPLPLDRGLLELDLALALDALPGAAAVAEAVQRSARSLPTLLRYGRRMADDATDVPRPAAELLSRGAQLALACLPELTPTQVADLNATIATARAAMAAQTHSQTLDREIAALTESLMLRSAEHLGDEVVAMDMPAARSFSVDWRLVPVGLLDSREETILVREYRRADGTTGVEVSVAAVPGSIHDSGLMARVVRGDTDAQVVASGLLDLDPTTGAYRGTMTLPGGLTSADRVDVFSVVATSDYLRSRTEVHRAQGIRCAARGFTNLRLAAAGAPNAAELANAAAGHFADWVGSADLFSPGAENSSRDIDVARGCWARCLELAGQIPAAARRRRQIVDPRVEPDWNSHGTAPALAEYAFLGLS